MQIVKAQDRYTTVAIALHWAIATLILFNLITGSFMERLSHEMKGIVVPLHTSSGITILLLSLIRVAWRLTHKPPPLDAALSPIERAAARTVHALLYVMMLTMPLIGWSIQSASARLAQSYYFFVLPMPKIMMIAQLPTAQKAAMHERFVMMHATGAWIMVVLLLVHVSGALKHQLIDRRPQLARMGVGGLPTP